jgi:hypothetical protein
MRIKVVRRPSRPSIDGLQLDRFERGCHYDVGTSLGALMLAEGWAEPAVDDPALVIPFSETDALPVRPERTPDTLLKPGAGNVPIVQRRMADPACD